MKISELLLPEFDNEMASTRKILERVPADKGAWKPHEKSFSLGHLAQHVARLPGWVTMTMSDTSLDLGKGFPGYTTQSTAELLAELDGNVSAARAAIAAASDADFNVEWTLKWGDRTLFAMPRYMVVRTMAINHVVHHRAQLGVYLRLNYVPLPGMYGPTADEPM